MPSPLQAEFDYFIANQEAIVKRYQGRVVVIKDKTIIGDYADEVDAVTETSKTHAVGTFLIQRAEPGTDAYTQTFYSRVAFAR